MADAFDEYYKKLLDARSMAQTPQAVSQGTVGDIDLSKASPAGSAAGGAFNISGTSQATQAGLAQYGQRYQVSDAVSQAKDYLQGVMDKRPGEYSSNYSGQIASLYDQIMNRPEFKYDVNKDPLFQSYKNNYMQTGQRAMQDAVGTAAGLTGGYGNSWGATAGYQAYQWYLQQLNNAIPDLEQRAFDKYRYYGDELRNNMNMSMALDEMEYGRYRDTVADWMADRQFANTLYGQERNWDMADWENTRNYYQDLAKLENSDYWAGENFRENQRQFDETLAENKRQADLLEAYRRDALAEDARQFDAGLAEKIRQADMSDKLERERLAEDARQYDAGLAEKIREYDADLVYKYYGTNLDEAFRRDELGERSRWFDEELANKKYEYQDTREYNIGRDAVRDEQWNKEFDQAEYWNQKNFAYQENRDAKQDAWNQKLYDQSEQHYQDTRADSQRQWEHMLEREGVEDTRYEDTTQYNREQAAITNALNQAELDALIDYRNSTLGLDREKFEFEKYLKMLQLEGLTGGSGGGGGGGSETPEAAKTGETTERAPVGNITDVIWPQQLDRETGLLNNPMADRETLDALVSSLPKPSTGNPSSLTDRINATKISNPLNTTGASAFVQQAMNNGYTKEQAEELDTIINGAKAKESDEEKKEKKKKTQLAAAAAARYLTEQ